MATDAALESRLPPSDREAERSVLGSMLRDNSVIPEVMLLVNAKSFYQFAHQTIFHAIAEVFGRQVPVDPVTLADCIHERGLTQDIGGAAYIVEIWDAAPSVSNAIHYAEIVRGYAIKRALVRVGHEIEGLGYEGGDWKHILGEAEKKLFAISSKVRKVTLKPFADAVTRCLDRMDARRTRDQDKLLMTGLRKLDAITGGIDAGNLVIIGARPGVGKTVLAMNLAFDIAEEGDPILIVSIEQEDIELAERMLSNRSNVPAYQIRRARLDLAADENKLLDAADWLKKAKVIISDEPTQTTTDICASIRQAKHKHGIRCCFIDYLQLITPEDTRIPRQEQVANMTRSLKLIARETGVIVFLLAQINRESEQGADKRPKLHQLRESGAIEANADVCWLLHCEDPTEPTIEVIVAKNRHGLTGPARMHFDRTRLKILDTV
jgi:replicative DNA helicase